jgi:diguanylate cyclase (GGDEF)-like protein
LYGALLFLDLDNFKVLNDTLGHDVGDQLLIEAAKRILSCVREGDTVARLGGDEFVMLLEGIDGNIEIASNKVALISEKIRATLSEPYQLGDHIQYSTPSIGVSLYLGNEKSLEVLLKSADIALYQAKNAGRNLVRFFDPDMQHDVEAHAALEADLRQAVSERQLRLYYQIQVDADMHPLGAEALVRWLHPIRGLISPMEFIPVAEESKLILDIGGWVLESACQQLSVWAKDEMSSQLSIAVNVSAQQFRQADFVESVESMLRTYRLNAFAAETGVDRKRGAE